jgi:hypothetical protein
MCPASKVDVQLLNIAQLVDRLVAHDLIRAHSTTSGHRPSPSQAQSVIRIQPLLQGFRTCAPVQAAHDTSTIDFFFFPDIPPPPPDNPFQKLRVPLLPDNYAPDRSANSGHEVDTPDGAVARSEVVVVASRPEDVLPAAMTEVVGNEGQERGIEELTKSFKSGLEEMKEPGVVKELWDGLMDDIFGPKTPKAAT